MKHLENRLAVRSEVNKIRYHRPPTIAELKFGHGATHYADFFIEECCFKNTRIPKKWFISKRDRLRYYL